MEGYSMVCGFCSLLCHCFTLGLEQMTSPVLHLAYLENGNAEIKKWLLSPHRTVTRLT